MNETGIPEIAEIESVVVQAIARSLDREPRELSLDGSLEEYGAESLDTLEVVFTLEKHFRIRLPKQSLMQRAVERFGEGTLVRYGDITPVGLQMLRQLRPEIDPGYFRPGLRLHEVNRLVTARTFVRLVLRVLEAKQEALLQLREQGCPACGSHRVLDSVLAAEFTCEECGATYPPPSGDEVILRDLASLRLDGDAQ